MAPSAPLLQVRQISKSFSRIPVLEGVSFDVQSGEVHALVGENGAGKSTLMNIVSGVLAPDSGEILWEDRPVRLDTPRAAQTLGIAFVHQELALVPQLSVTENIFLGRHLANRGLVNFAAMRRRVEQVLAELGSDIDPRRPVSELSLAARQIVEIARAVAFESRLIIMDEPTAPLGDRETEALFRVIRVLRTRGAGVVYISHRMKEIFEISDRVTVLRDGKHVLTQAATRLRQEELVRAMIGGELKEKLDAPPPAAAGAGQVLRTEGRINLTVHRGEIVGLAGLAGAGRTSLLESLFGAGRKDPATAVFVNGVPLRQRTPGNAIRAGLSLVPDDRKYKGLVLGASVLHNIALAGDRSRFFVPRARQEQAARQWIGSLRIRVSGLNQPVAHLSGGTQQKVVLAKWLYAGARVFLLDEPTRGIDVGAKAEIYDTIRSLAGSGAAILMASSELEELMGLADRIVVMHRGGIAGELSRSEATEEKIMHLATGATPISEPRT